MGWKPYSDKGREVREQPCANKQKKKQGCWQDLEVWWQTLISSVQTRRVTRLGERAGFYIHTPAIDSFPSVRTFFSPSLHPSSPFSQPSLLSENNPAIRGVNKQDHELISRTSQSHRWTWRHFSLSHMLVYLLFIMRLSVPESFSDILMGFESRTLMFMSLYVKKHSAGWEMFVCSSKAELIHRALSCRGNMAEEKWKSSASWDRGV